MLFLAAAIHRFEDLKPMLCMQPNEKAKSSSVTFTGPNLR